jgi:hypothetical protein
MNQCAKCDKTFKSQYMLNRHINKKVPCETIKKTPKIKSAQYPPIKILDKNIITFTSPFEDPDIFEINDFLPEHMDNIFKRLKEIENENNEKGTVILCNFNYSKDVLVKLAPEKHQHAIKTLYYQSVNMAIKLDDINEIYRICGIHAVWKLQTDLFNNMEIRLATPEEIQEIQQNEAKNKMLTSIQ